MYIFKNTNILAPVLPHLSPALSRTNPHLLLLSTHFPILSSILSQGFFILPAMLTLLVSLAYPLAAVAVVLFGLFACIYQYIRQKNQGHSDTPEFFLTARGSVKTFTVAW